MTVSRKFVELLAALFFLCGFAYLFLVSVYVTTTVNEKIIAIITNNILNIMLIIVGFFFGNSARTSPPGT